jgi:uridine phosphorylase
MSKIESSELVLNADNSVYHLNLHPYQLAKDIILVGDPGRVKLISKYFDTIEYTSENREIITHTGTFNGKKITVLSTGMGTDNIDIVVNELDALVNIDLETRTIKKEHTSLNFIRIGTTGALQEDIPINNFIVSEYALGLDGLLNYYQFDATTIEIELLEQFYQQSNYSKTFAQPYFIKGDEKLFNLFCNEDKFYSGITATAPGFYGPQGRLLRIPLKEPQINEKLNQFKSHNLRVTNFEMETSAIYGLSRALGHRACTVCMVLANRFTKEFSTNHQEVMQDLIQITLQKLTS